MNSFSTSKLPGKTLGNLAIAGSLCLHVGLIAVFSSWQWDGATLEKTPPKIVTIKFMPASPSSQSTETPSLPKTTPMPPARPMTTQPNAKSRLMPRTPSLSTPTLSPVKMAYQMIRSHSNTIKRSLSQPTSFANTKLIPAVSPVNFSQHSQRTAIHRRSPTSEIRISRISHTPARTAIPTEPSKMRSTLIHRRPGPAQSSTTAQVSFVSPVAVEPLASKQTVRHTFAALPRELPQSLPIDREASDTPDANLGALRGLFTGKVRQRIANAKYYPRIARRRGMEGRPIIAFTLDRQGRLTKVDLAQTSGYQLLDRAALKAVHQAAPYPEIPAPLKMNSFQFKLPISFVLK